VSTSTTEQAVRYDTSDGDQFSSKRRVMYTVFTVFVTAVVALAVLEAAVRTPAFGEDRSTARASGSGADLEVRYPSVSRGQLLAPLEITVHMPPGSSDPITISITSDWTELFLTDDVSPEPTAETTTDTANLMTFSPPSEGQDLQIEIEQETRPSAWFRRRSGTVAVLDASGRPMVSVTVRTDVRP
jgi:hypothetical protein